MTKPFALIIEDDPKLGRIFSVALNQIGFETELDDVGTNYRSIMESRIPSVVFLDVHLPFAFGANILDEIRSDERWKHIPVVVMTADIAMAKALQKKADTSLLKPVSVLRIQEIGSKIISGLAQD
ncbi:MAG: response regulator [Anaerolineae bacterium]|nr:response regulator [Anaerolineae bacterium]